MSEELETATDQAPAQAAQLAFVARQAIYDSNVNVTAYELLYRHSQTARSAHIVDDVQATLHVIVNMALEIGLERLADNLPMHINYPEELLVAAVPPPFPAAGVVIEVLESVRCNPEVLKGLATFRAHGFHIALDDFCMKASDPMLLDSVDTVKLDISQFADGELPEVVHTLKTRGLRLIAEHVETTDEFNYCKSLGFDAYQGYFLQHPQMFSARPVPSNRLGALRLIAQLQQGEPALSEVARLISQDVSLSYRVLRCINSSYYGYAKKVESIRQAIVMLGLEKVRQLCALVALRSIDDRPPSVFIDALTRARMCENIGTLRRSQSTPSLFMTGLFSTLDVITGVPMRDLLQELPLRGAIPNALLTQQGPLGLILREVVAYERGAWNSALFRGVTPDAIQEAYLEAVGWARAALAMTSA